MLSELTQRSLQTMWNTTVSTAEAKFPREQTGIAQELSARGMLRSSVHVQLVDQLAAKSLAAVAADMFEQLAEADRSESSADSEGRIEVLAGLFGAKVRAFHGFLRDAAPSLHGRLGLTMLAAKPETWTHELDAALAHAESYWPAKIRVTIIGSATAATRGTPVTNTVNVNQGSTVANVQFGANSMASAHQTVTQTTGVDVAALVASLTELIEGLSKAITVPQADRAEVSEVLTELRTEVTKPAPNKRRLAALMTGASDVVKLVPGLSKTWELASTHGHLLIEGLSKITS